ncbi:MAG: ComF family protein [Alphaproteobacteria bacterium]|nr:ComF family protein [Alphaproteobacteria bacterium]
MSSQLYAVWSTWRDGVRTLGRRLGRQLAHRALDAVLPPRCLECGAQVDAPIDAPGALCPACWRRIAFLTPPWCACCGHPFEVEAGPDSLCGACIAEPPPFVRARAVFRYDDASRGLILRFKHADRTDSAPAFGRWLARAGDRLLADNDLIVPVPMHWFRLFVRRYNQASLLALALARATDNRVPALPDALQRRRWTPIQGRLGRAARRDNVKGAIAVRSDRADALAGKRVLVVDDVFTTGATASACAHALLGAGAASVDVLTLARVVRD